MQSYWVTGRDFYGRAAQVIISEPSEGFITPTKIPVRPSALESDDVIELSGTLGNPSSQIGKCECAFAVATKFIRYGRNSENVKQIIAARDQDEDFAREKIT
jgi:hypothetical protein